MKKSREADNGLWGFDYHGDDLVQMEENTSFRTLTDK